MSSIATWRLPIVIRRYLIPIPSGLNVQLLGCTDIVVCIGEIGLMHAIVVALGSTYGCQGPISITCCNSSIVGIGLAGFPFTFCMGPINPNEGSYTWLSWAILILTWGGFNVGWLLINIPTISYTWQLKCLSRFKTTFILCHEVPIFSCMSSPRYLIKDFIVTPIYGTPLVFSCCIVVFKKKCLASLTLLTIFHHLITMVSNWSQGSIQSMFTRISSHLTLMNIRTFVKSQFGCLNLLDSRDSIEYDCDVITSFVILVCLWGLP